jgi:nitrite reductase/ring-hydroxylating ferredoxin subunit
MTDVTTANGWVDVCAADELADGEATVLKVIPPVAVFHVDGEFRATDDTCTHAESSLAEGYIEDGTVECEFHFAKFCIKTGEALTRPAVTPLRTYPVAITDGRVLVDLSSRRAG